MKRIMKIYVAALLLLIFIGLPGRLYAENIEAQLPSSDGSDGFQVKDSGGTPLMHVDSSGDVGIGTITPEERLQVEGNIKVLGETFREYVDFKPAGPGDKWIRIGFSNQNNGSRPLHLYVTRSESWDNSTPPGGPALELTCLGRESGSGQQYCTALYGYHGASGAGMTHITIKDNGAGGSFVYLRLAGDVTYRFWTADDSGTVSLPPQDDATGAPDISDPDVDRLYSINQGVNVIGDNGNNLYVSGNVGVGTANPAFKLDVSGQANATELCIDGICKTGWDQVGITTETDPTVLASVKDGVSWDEVSVKPGDLTHGSGSTNYLGKWTSTYTLGSSLIYDDGTNVGIGTITPGYKLDVAGGLRVAGDLDMGTYRITNLADPSSSHDAATMAYVDNRPDKFWSGDLGGSIYNNNSGNVGIGTNIPTYKLDVVGNIKTSGLLVSNPDPAILLDKQNALTYTLGTKPLTLPFSEWLYINTYRARDLYVRLENTYPDNDLGLSVEGKVGIGTTNPTAKLDVAGDLKVSGSVLLQGVSHPAIRFISGGDYRWEAAPDGNFYLYDQTNSAYRLHVTAGSGNVGIGTTSPSYKLDVAGSLRVSGVMEMSGNRITNLADPTSPQDAATKAYVDSGRSFRGYVNFTPSGSGLKWIRMRYFGQNYAELPIHIYVTRGIDWNNSTPYGGPSLELTCLGQEWHYGQQYCVAIYGYHGDPGADITHAAIRNNGAGGYYVYLRLYGGVTYRIWTANDSGYIESPVDDPTDAPSANYRYALAQGFNIIGDVGNSLYVSGNAIVAGNLSVGTSNLRTDAAVYGETFGLGSPTGSSMGVFGWAANTGPISGGGAMGVYGRVSSYASNPGIGDAVPAGVYGDAVSTTGVSFGVKGSSNSTDNRSAAVVGVVSGSSSAGKAIWGDIRGVTNPLAYAGYFDGKVYVAGNFDVAGTVASRVKSFKIDHPLDPQNKYLIHASIESPEMKNLYDGIAVLDENGEAWIELPTWFEALNKDFRYQLTCIGGFAPVYIAEKIANNRFKIAGGTPGMEVSWQVTGIRHDLWANDHPLIVEQNKPPEERGTYLYPEGYNK